MTSKNDYDNHLYYLEKKLEEIEERKTIPLSGAGNNYRQAAELICKLILIGNEKDFSGNLESLISKAKKEIDAIGTRDSGLFSSSLSYIQKVGNEYSHGNVGGEVSESLSQEEIYSFLCRSLHIAFFGQTTLVAPKLPHQMTLAFPPRALQRGRFENLRAEDVVKIKFPKQKVFTKEKEVDSFSKIYYDYIVTEIEGVELGYLFLRTNSSLEKSIDSFNVKIKESMPYKLTIITPRVYNSLGKEIDRKKSINSIYINSISKQKISYDFRKVNIEYFDDFLWENCLPTEMRTLPSSSQHREYIIPQKISKLENDDSSHKDEATRTYIRRLLDNSESCAPLQIIVGPAGIGKTTFCDDVARYIDEHKHKRGLLLSATDFRDIEDLPLIESVSDLYTLAVKRGFFDTYEMENLNFEINLGCGNLVLLIDGFDEIESHLGALLNFSKFIDSLIQLDENFRKVLVILTVRDYEIQRFRYFHQIDIYRLKGFSNDDAHKYFKEKIPDNAIPQAKKLLETFQEGNNFNSLNNNIIPLYVSLICDFLLENTNATGKFPDHTDSIHSYFLKTSLDILIINIIDREVAKQSLGEIGRDEFFAILIAIIAEPLSQTTRAKLVDVMGACVSNPNLALVDNFGKVPFVRTEGELVSFRYDSLTFFFKSRLLARQIRNGTFQSHPDVEFFSEGYQGDGPLFDELRKILDPEDFSMSQNTFQWFQGLRLSYRNSKGSPKEDSHIKAISAFLYWAGKTCPDKNDRTKVNNFLFNGDDWENFCIIGQYYPLNLRSKKVFDSYIENYTNIVSCEHLVGEIIFYYTNVKFDDRSIPDRLDKTIFDDTCTFSDNVSYAFSAKDQSDANNYNAVRDNLYKIIKVGFRANHFNWKSQNIYRKVTIIGRISLEDYIGILISHGVLLEEESHSKTEKGYVIADKWKGDARKLIEEKRVTGKMGKIISNILCK
ncbi:NACHT domain-containing protein [Acetobacter sicerae]|uniref:NACHT domain-containing protein n=1 Tax=Acetobacter sicerae TaxID=85325 RepID=UPI00156B10BF|nr:NACHT domain-containing protein [Acetobacter sicerae]NHN90849.1 NACHT domain-containing protein [Acetobacter sicerae]